MTKSFRNNFLSHYCKIFLYLSISIFHPALQRQFRLYIPFLGLRGLSPNFHINVSVSDLYIRRIGPHISSSRKSRPIVQIYYSRTDTWMWKLGLRPRYSFSGNIFFQIFGILSLQCVPQSPPSPSFHFPPHLHLLSYISIALHLHLLPLFYRVSQIPNVLNLPAPLFSQYTKTYTITSV